MNQKEVSISMIVWNKETGDFRRASQVVDSELELEEVAEFFETKYDNYRVIHIFKGLEVPKTYRSLAAVLTMKDQ